MYLFQRIVLCCKEVGAPPGGKKGSKSNSILKKPAAKRRTSLQLKGRIFIANITQAVPIQRGNIWFLEIIWRGDAQDESFSLKCVGFRMCAGLTRADAGPRRSSSSGSAR